MVHARLWPASGRGDVILECQVGKALHLKYPHLKLVTKVTCIEGFEPLCYRKEFKTTIISD